jgi:hypothetical protein
MFIFVCSDCEVVNRNMFLCLARNLDSVSSLVGANINGSFLDIEDPECKSPV